MLLLHQKWKQAGLLKKKFSHCIQKTGTIVDLVKDAENDDWAWARGSTLFVKLASSKLEMAENMSTFTEDFILADSKGTNAIKMRMGNDQQKKSVDNFLTLDPLVKNSKPT